MTVRSSNSIRQLLKSINRFHSECMPVPSGLTWKPSQQHFLLAVDGGKSASSARPREQKPRTILWLSVPRKQQKPRVWPCAWPENSKIQISPAPQGPVPALYTALLRDGHSQDFS
ncbi:hypothetical protein PoB_000728100 [Plakobranchus ocellatus]|uniref:Uncharacterized protein n=1 Tax=Plakobranchus ocellatus TaxID=259542 RepID=A0AAV3YC63_9GAST|nr:hypothetical protein PoB_000728100 [Plakobranchus ocellatus]